MTKLKPRPPKGLARIYIPEDGQTELRVILGDQEIHITLSEFQEWDMCRDLHGAIQRRMRSRTVKAVDTA